MQNKPGIQRKLQKGSVPIMNFIRQTSLRVRTVSILSFHSKLKLYLMFEICLGRKKFHLQFLVER